MACRVRGEEGRTEERCPTRSSWALYSSSLDVYRFRFRLKAVDSYYRSTLTVPATMMLTTYLYKHPGLSISVHIGRRITLIATPPMLPAVVFFILRTTKRLYDDSSAMTHLTVSFAAQIDYSLRCVIPEQQAHRGVKQVNRVSIFMKCLICSTKYLDWTSRKLRDRQVGIMAI